MILRLDFGISPLGSPAGVAVGHDHGNVALAAVVNGLDDGICFAGTGRTLTRVTVTTAISLATVWALALVGSAGTLFAGARITFAVRNF